MSGFFGLGRTGLLGGILRDRRGVAAVEFAIIAPLLLCMYFVTMEVAQGIETNKKVGRVGSMVGDLVAQQPAISAAEIDAIMRIGESILQPYNRSDAVITVTAIQMNGDEPPTATVAWSRKLSDGTFSEGLAEGQTVSFVPATLRTPNTFLIRTEAELAYEPVLTWAAADKEPLGLAAAFDGIGMGETYYHRPRMSNTIPCNGC